MSAWNDGVRTAAFVAAIWCSLVAVAYGGDAALAARGKALFTEQGCYGCHTIEKFGTPIAPDLSHVGSKLKREALARWLRDPSAQRPTAHMPKIELSKSEGEALAEYLSSLR
jgi:mono/diheme cytochrome c family protein